MRSRRLALGAGHPIARYQRCGISAALASAKSGEEFADPDIISNGIHLVACFDSASSLDEPSTARCQREIEKYSEYPDRIARDHRPRIVKASANGYFVFDRYGETRLDDPTNLTYFYTDNLHLNDVGTDILVAIDLAAIQAAFV